MLFLVWAGFNISSMLTGFSSKFAISILRARYVIVNCGYKVSYSSKLFSVSPLSKSMVGLEFIFGKEGPR